LPSDEFLNHLLLLFTQNKFRFELKFWRLIRGFP